jgi:hypothetical protein
LARIRALEEREAALSEALKPFAALAMPVHAEEPGRTHLDAMDGPDGTGEFYLATHFGTRRECTMWADDFRRARAALTNKENDRG